MPRFRLLFSRRTASDLQRLERANPAKHRKVLRTLGLLETNLRHPSLRTHEFSSFTGAAGEKVFEAYVDAGRNAYRIFWCYGPEQGVITVLAITPHP